MKDIILRRLAGTTPASDPAAAALRRLPAQTVAALYARPLIPAAVLVPLVSRAGGLTVLLTRRTEHLRDHAGQVSFPGGRVDPADPDPGATALREAREELGIAAAAVEIAGYLPPHAVVTGFVVTPLVGFLAADVYLRPDPLEVAEAFEVPLEYFLDPAHVQRSVRQVHGVDVPLLEFHYGGHRIWGATANIVQTLIESLLNTND